MENGGFLFAAYAIIWALVFGYVFLLVRRQSTLKRRLDSIKEEMSKKHGG